MPYPIAHGLVGASVVAFCRPNRPMVADWKVLIAGASLAVSPDCDFFFVWVLGWSSTWHRGFTHSILFAFLVTGVALILTSGAYLKPIFIGGLVVLSHGVLDFLTTKNDGGVELLWPVLRGRFKLGVFGVSEAAFNHHDMVGLSKAMLSAALIEAVIFGPLLIVVVMIRLPVNRLLRRLVARRQHR